MPVETMSEEVRADFSKWELIHALLGGTKAMRDGGDKWLPRFEKESERSFASRLSRAVLYNALADTIDKIVARPFQKTVTVKGKLPVDLEPMIDDVDKAKTSLTQFARSVFDNLVTYGRFHVMVDFPAIPANYSLAEQRSRGYRPFFRRIDPITVLGRKWTIDANGNQVLAQIRIAETLVEDNSEDEFGTVDVETIRVYDRVTLADESVACSYRLYKLVRKETKVTWEQVNETVIMTYPGIPLFTCLVDENPPLEDLGWINLLHYQSLSDQRNILAYARCAILFGKGFSDEEVSKGITIGGNAVNLTNNKDAMLSYVEISGSAMAAGEKDIQALEGRMQVLGLQPQVRASGGSDTATGKVIDESRSETELQAWIRETESTLYECFAAAARWMDEELDDEFSIDIYSEFSASTLLRDIDINILMELWKGGLLQDEDLLVELKRRGVLSDSTTIDKLIQNKPTAIVKPDPELDNVE